MLHSNYGDGGEGGDGGGDGGEGGDGGRGGVGQLTGSRVRVHLGHMGPGSTKVTQFHL